MSRYLQYSIITSRRKDRTVQYHYFRFEFAFLFLFGVTTCIMSFLTQCLQFYRQVQYCTSMLPPLCSHHTYCNIPISRKGHMLKSTVEYVYIYMYRYECIYIQIYIYKAIQRDIRIISMHMHIMWVGNSKCLDFN